MQGKKEKSGGKKFNNFKIYKILIIFNFLYNKIKHKKMIFYYFYFYNQNMSFKFFSPFIYLFILIFLVQWSNLDPLKSVKKNVRI